MNQEEPNVAGILLNTEYQDVMDADELITDFSFQYKMFLVNLEIGLDKNLNLVDA
jgi:hypothetical protein